MTPQSIAPTTVKAPARLESCALAVSLDSAEPLPEGWPAASRADFGDAPAGTRCFRGADIDPERYRDGEYLLITPFGGECLERVDGHVHIVGTVYARLEKDPADPRWRRQAGDAADLASLEAADAYRLALDDCLRAAGSFATALALIRHGRVAFLERLRNSYGDDPLCEPLCYGVLWPTRHCPPETAERIAPETAGYVAAKADALGRETGEAALATEALARWRADAEDYAAHVAGERARDAEQGRRLEQQAARPQALPMSPPSEPMSLAA